MDISFFVRCVSAGLALSAPYGCAGSAGYRPGEPCEVLLRDYRSELTLSLRNESHTAREKLFQPSANATAKIVSDELMELLVERMEERGFFRHAAVRPLPHFGAPGIHFGIGVEIAGSARSLLRVKGMDPDLASAMIEMQQSFREFYDGTFQGQRIPERGAEYFRDQQRKIEESRKKTGDAP